MIWVDQNGYSFFRVGEDGEKPSRAEICQARTLAHHRVLAYSWGIIDGLWTPIEVDHENVHPWVDTEWNLQGLTKSEHTRKTFGHAKAGP